MSYAIFLSEEDACRVLDGTESYEQVLQEIADLLYEGDISEVRKFRKHLQVGNDGYSSFGISSESSGAHNRNF